MTAVRLSVFRPLGDQTRAPRKDDAHHVVYVFKVEAAAPLQWFKDHADELARRAYPDFDYDALMIEPYPGDHTQ